MKDGKFVYVGDESGLSEYEGDIMMHQAKRGKDVAFSFLMSYVWVKYWTPPEMSTSVLLKK
ncbi:MAG: hypothetical protein K6E91_15010 [Butyrivibrio sp.]|nr:hypothetical protein [Butyrivibrio sp.]